MADQELPEGFEWVDDATYGQKGRRLSRMTAAKLRETWTVDAEGGHLIRPDGTVEPEYIVSGDYRQVIVPGAADDAARERVHRIIWAIVHGRWADLVDHRNGDPADNRLSNLRELTPSQNALNKKACHEARHIRWMPSITSWEIKMWDGQKPWIEYRATFCAAYHRRAEMLVIRARRNGIGDKDVAGDCLAKLAKLSSAADDPLLAEALRLKAEAEAAGRPHRSRPMVDELPEFKAARMKLTNEAPDEPQ